VRRAAKIDANQPEIIAALERAGCIVQTLAAVGHGVPDLLVGVRGGNYLLEVKAIGGKLTDDQREWHGEWGGAVHIVRTPEEALRAVGLLP
jgi:hypothetical protein